MDQILLGALHHNFSSCLRLALAHGLGLEVQAFAFPDVFTGNGCDLLSTYQRAGLDRLAGPLAIHGPFINLAPDSPDPLIRDVTLRRIYEGLEVAAALGAQKIVFHASFLSGIRHPRYRQGWTQRSIDFWGPVAERAARQETVIALENMWEPEPTVITDVLEAVNSPYLRACLDVGHTFLFADVPLEDWLRVLGPYLVHLHLNNNPGDIDEHQALTDGVLDYDTILPQIRRLRPSPSLTLEMNTVQAMQESFRYLHLPQRCGVLPIHRRHLTALPSR